MTTRWIGSAGRLNAVGRGRTIVGQVEVRWRRKSTSDKASGRAGGFGHRVRVTAGAWRDSRPIPPTVVTPPRPTTLGFRFLRFFRGPSFYALSLVMPVITLAAALSSSAPMIRSLPSISILMSLGTAWYAFLIMPSMDLLLGDEPQEDVRDWSSCTDTRWGRWILYTYAFLHCIVLGLACALACRAAWGPFLGVALSCGVSNGILFTVAHELLHGQRRMDRILANVLLAVVCYGHWSQSHLLHHVKVATPEDPSSARKGETLWAFIPRSIVGNIVDGYSFERGRRMRKGIPFWDVRNRALGWVGGPLLLAALCTIFCGPKGILFFIIQAIIGVVMLESVNYIEHYGLQRKQVNGCQYEKVGPQHSWNANTMYTNACSFRLQRHSYHHANESSPFYLLRSDPEAPQLPASYSTMMMLALFPPLFFHVMDPRVECRREMSSQR